MLCSLKAFQNRVDQRMCFASSVCENLVLLVLRDHAHDFLMESDPEVESIATPRAYMIARSYIFKEAR